MLLEKSHSMKKDESSAMARWQGKKSNVDIVGRALSGNAHDKSDKFIIRTGRGSRIKNHEDG